MIRKDENFFINHSIFVKFKKKFDFLRFIQIKQLKKVFVNERIIEIPFVLQNIPKGKKLEILDLGCSASPLPIHMATLGHKVVGVDFRNYPYIHSNFTFKKADIMNLPFQDNYFDLITCISTLEHIGLGFYGDTVSGDLPDKEAMQQIKRVLKDKGILLLSVPFGVKKDTDQQRIYDPCSLDALLNDFQILEKDFFVNIIKDKLNYWEVISEEEASRVDSKDGSTNCVCLIKTIIQRR